jgi:hypothetical protein
MYAKTEEFYGLMDAGEWWWMVDGGWWELTSVHAFGGTQQVPHVLHKTCLIMDEVDGMSGGDRGGIAEIIDMIKKTRTPIICICNDAWSQKIKSLKCASRAVASPFSTRHEPVTIQCQQQFIRICREWDLLLTRHSCIDAMTTH